MRIEFKAASQLSPGERAQLEALFDEAFPPDGTDIQWSISDRHILVREGEEIVSNVGILERTATVGGRPVRLGGIGGVATRIAWRKRGLAKAAMKVAQDYLRDPLAVEFGLLVCGENMLPYYAKLGWKRVTVPMWIEQPKGRVLFPGPIMILPVCEQDWPEGEIDLKGRPW
jgi:aminoglycoside 2'-N-acetyltransferase I